MTYAKETPAKDRASAHAAITSAVKLLNDNAARLSGEEKKSIANIRTIDVDPTASRSSVDVVLGTLHVNAGQLTEDPARFATDIAHDSFHIAQWKAGSPSSGAAAERDATHFQIGIGRKIGLSEKQIGYLKNYADHIDNYKDYWGSPVTHPVHH